MKFSLTYFVSIVIIFVISLIGIPTDACEQECRTGISLAFGDNYVIEIKGLFETFLINLQENIFAGFKGEVSASARSECYNVIYEELDKFQSNFTGNFSGIIEDSIFWQTPQFRGQCQ